MIGYIPGISVLNKNDLSTEKPFIYPNIYILNASMGQAPSQALREKAD